MDDKNQNNLQNEQSTAPVKTEKKCPCRGRLRRVLVLLLAVVLIASAFMLVRYFVQTRTMQESNDSAASLANAVIPSLLKPKPEGTDAETTEPREEGAVPGTNATSRPNVEPGVPIQMEQETENASEATVTPTESVAQSMLGIDLAALQAVNPDVLGWIAIPDTVLSYPLLQTVDNQYYLNTTWDLQSNQAGAIYLECTNEPDLSEFHTIVYGHRWNDDSMFGSLKYYVDENYKNQHPYVFIVTADGCYRYEIFAAYEASVRSLTYLIEFETEQITRDFLNFCVSMSAWPPGMYLEVGDQILTLSTCTGTGSPNRWVVQARLAEVTPRE